MKIRIDKDYKNAALVAVFLTALSYIIGIAFGWITGVVWLEAFAVITSYACVWLCDHQRRFQYIVGAITTVAYSVLFWQSALVASAIVNAYLAIQLVYGWFRWRPDEITRPVTRTSLKEVPLYLLATAALFGGAFWITTAFGGAMAALDVAILCGNVLAQWMLDNKKLENWAVWAAVNVLSIVVYARAGLPLVALQYVAFLANTVYGWVKWSKSREVADPLADRYLDQNWNELSGVMG